MNTDPQALQASIEQILKGSMAPHFGQPLSADRIAPVLSSIADTVHSMLSRLGECMRSAIVARPAWDCMTTWEKCKWFLVNRLVPSIGKELRKQHDIASGLRYQLVEAAAEHGDRFIPTAMEMYDVPSLPHWALDDPHGVIIVDFTFVPPTPVERITFTGTIPPL